MAANSDPEIAPIPKQDLQVIENEFMKGGMVALKAYIESNLDDWTSIPLNIAVTGRSGTGKSSYINAIRGLNGDDDEAAAVGETQQTTEPTAYKYPEHPNIVFWDLPGVGTPDFEEDTYLEKAKLHKYDFFLIMSHPRFSTNDLWLADTICKSNKKFFYVRTKVGIDVKNDKISHPITHNKKKLLETITKNSMKIFFEGGLKKINNCDIFLIDNHETHLYDFGKLSARLHSGAPAWKSEAMILSLSVLSKEVIEAKRKMLKIRIWKAALASAATAAVPVPGVGEVADAAILLHEAILYREQFGLTDKALQKTASTLKMSLDDLKRSANLKITAISFTVAGLIKFGGALVFTAAAENAVQFTIPVLGSLIAGGISFGTTFKCLDGLLKLMVEDALTINEKIQTHLL